MGTGLQIEGWMLKDSIYLFIQKFLELFCFHPQNITIQKGKN